MSYIDNFKLFCETKPYIAQMTISFIVLLAAGICIGLLHHMLIPFIICSVIAGIALIVFIHGVYKQERGATLNQDTANASMYSAN